MNKSQAVLDAEQDVEALRVMADSLADESNEAYAVWTLLREADTTFPADRWPVERCAHAAFEAVPALKESK